MVHSRWNVIVTEDPATGIKQRILLKNNYQSFKILRKTQIKSKSITSDIDIFTPGVNFASTMDTFSHRPASCESAVSNRIRRWFQDIHQKGVLMLEY